MSEQIQSLLNEMENKFEQSFSETNLDHPLNKQLNPQSSRKVHQQKQKQLESTELKDDHFDSMKIDLLRQLSHSDQNDNQQDKNITKFKSNVRLSASNQNQKYNQRENTPSFRPKQDIDNSQLQDLRHVTSQQQFQKMSYSTSHPNEQNPFYYKELTTKLQRALQKISSDKIIISHRLQNNRNQANFYDRFEQFQQKRKRQIEKKRQQLQQNEIKKLKFKPLINSHSKALVSQTSSEPIYIRCDKIIEKKKQRQEQYKKIREQREQKQFEQYKKQYDSYANALKQKYQGKNIRSSEQYYDEMQNWLKKKSNNIQNKIVQNSQKQKNSNTFRPLINSKSQKILLTKKEQRRIPIHERQPKLKQEFVDLNCTFKPKINKTNFHKKMTFYQAPF